MVVSLAPLNAIMPILAFVFIFVLIYALLMKTKVLDANPWVSLFLSLVMASFFVVNTQLVEFTKLNVSWVMVFVVCLLMIMLVLGFVGKEATETFTKNKTFAGALVGILVLIFVVSSSYVFNWVINWDLLQTWFDEDWFGMVILAVVAGIVFWKVMPVPVPGK